MKHRATALRIDIRLTAASIVALGAVGIADPAAAQDAPTAADTDEIVVTARRGAENIQSTPVSVTAFNNEMLRQSGINQTSDLMIKTPGVYLGGSGGRENSTFQIRGQSKARAGFNAPAVISYFADVPMPTFGSSVETYDLQSVQVLKGPQGTLFGRNTTGGAVLFYPAAPTYDAEGYVQAGYGNFDHKQLEGAVSVPIVDGKVAIRLSGKYDKRDGYSYNITQDVWLDDRDMHAMRASLLLEPVESIRNLTIFDYYHNDYNGDAVVLTGVRATTPLLQAGTRAGALAVLARQRARGPRIVESDAPSVNKSTRWGITNRTDVDLSDDLQLVNIFGFRRSYLRYVSNTDAVPQLPTTTAFPGTVLGAPFTNLNGSAGIHAEQITNEVQLKGTASDGRIEWLLGGFYLHSKPYGANGTGGKQFSQAPLSIAQTFFGNNFLTEDSRAVFANVAVNLDNAVEGLKLNLGARYTWDKFESCTASESGVNPGYVDPDVCDAGAAPLINPRTNKGKSSAPTWQASLEWQATPDLFTYVVTRRGYRAGGINSPTLAGRLVPFQTFGPEKVTDVEAGFRSDWNFGGDTKLRLNASAFIGWYDGVSTSISGLRTSAATCVVGAPPPVSPDGDCNASNDPTNGALTVNAGKSRVWGIDIDGFLAINRELKITFAGNLLRPKSTSFAVPAAIAPYVPLGTAIGFDFVAKNTYSAGIEYTAPLGDEGEVSARVDLYHSGKLSYVDSSLPAYTIANARLDFNSVHGAPIDIGLWATNLFDKEYQQQGIVNGPSAGIEGAIFGAPRMYGVSLRYRFGQ